jgi:glycosyltransferase involved in cell wall biosynthesis
MKNKRSQSAFVCVTNDLATDQRVHKTCMALLQCGYEVLEYGRMLPGSLPLQRPYRTLRVKHLFNRGPLFYAEYNIRLFVRLLFSHFDLVVSNDLDTLSAAYLAAKIRNKKIIYDTHEYFTETPELVNRPKVQKIWKSIEKIIFPKLKTVITVNDSIAKLYENEYGTMLHVIRNIPANFTIEASNKQQLELPVDKKILIIQGAGINIDRGAEEACEAMKYLDGFVLLIAGSGDVIPQLKKMVAEQNMEEKIIFRDRMDYKLLRQYTQLCDLGLAIDKNTNINYLYSLPNKLFDYLHAGIPVLSSGLPEIRKIIDEFQVGYHLENHDPQHIAQTIKTIFSDMPLYQINKENTLIASRELNWESEEKKLLNIFRAFTNVH